MDNPKSGERRVRSGVVRQTEILGGTPVFFVEEWRDNCPCPDCVASGHWQRVGNNMGYATKIGADMVVDPPKYTLGSGMDDLVGRVAALERRE